MTSNQSSPTPGVSPALSAEEWERQEFSTAEPRPSPYDERFSHHGRVVVDTYDEQAIYVMDRTLTGTGLTGANRHALAALALHGQPFGFSRADVKWLGDVIRFARERDAYEDELEVGESLLARIRALLPPESE